MRALGPVEQRAANGSSPVLIKEGKAFQGMFSWRTQGRQWLSTLEGLVEEERILGEDSLLSVEPVLCFLLTYKPRPLPFLFCLQALLTVEMFRM